MSGLKRNKKWMALMLSLMLMISAVLPTAAFAQDSPDSGAAPVIAAADSLPGDEEPGVSPSDAEEAASPADAVEEDPQDDAGDEQTLAEEATLPGPGGEPVPVPVPDVEAGVMAYEYLTVLSSVYGTRAAGTAGEVAARGYIVAEFEKMGYTVEVQPFTYGSRNSANVIATKEGVSTREVVVGAHYDAVTAGKGADDNASGVGVMMETAAALKDAVTPYTIKFVAFGAEEVGLRGSNYYVNQLSAENRRNVAGMINLDSLAAGDFMYIYGSAGKGGFIRDLGLDIVDRLDLDVITNPGYPGYPAGTTGDWSDHAPFNRAGIPIAYLEATNWDVGDNDGYTQTAANGSYWHSSKDTLERISADYPGRIEQHLSTFSILLKTILREVNEPSVEITLSNNKASITEKRTIDFEFNLRSDRTLDDIVWLYGGKPFSEWKSWASNGYNGAPFISFEEGPVLADGKVTGKITFDLPYGTTNLSGTHRRNYPALIGTYPLAALDKYTGTDLASSDIKLNAYDSYYTYDELKPKIDEITLAAEAKGRYVDNRVLGQSVEGRDIYFTILAKDKESVDKYVNETHPGMMDDPAGLQEKIRSGAFGDYKVPIWVNNIHPDEAPGIDAIVNFFEEIATEDSITYNVNKDASNPLQATLNMDTLLDNVIFLFNYTENPDGRVHNTRANVNGFDLNRDNSYQTQPETQIVTSEIAKWSPISFLDLHGFVGSFLIEPCTPPHDPNHEFDLLIDKMVAQAEAMGQAGIANTKYEVYHIPYEEHRKLKENPNYSPVGYTDGWDDASPAYTAVYAMHHGSMGHTIEIPELNEESTTALFYTLVAASQYVTENKEELFLNQLEIFKRGVEGIDDRSVDPYLINAKNESIGRPRGTEENFFPEYYVIPTSSELQKNPLEAYRMAEYLIRNGVKLEQTTESVSVNGITYPAGTYVVNMHQAKRGFANLVLYKGVDVSDFSAMYAEIVQNFPDLRGFNSYELRVSGAFAGKTGAVTSVTVPSSTVVSGDAAYYVIRSSNNDAIKAVNKLLDGGKAVSMLTAKSQKYGAGDYLVAAADLKTISGDFYLDIEPVSGIVPLSFPLKKLTLNATGVPAFVLKELGFTVTSIATNSDVLINATVNAANRTLIEEGKPYIGFGYSAINSFKNSNLVTGLEVGRTGGHEGVYKAVMNQNSVITAPYETAEYLYTASGGWIEVIPAGATVLAQNAVGNEFFKAGWWPNHERAEGKVTGMLYRQGKLNVTLFSNDLVNKAHPQHQYRLLANSIFATVQPVTVPDSSGPSTPSDPGTTPTNPGTDPSTPVDPVDPGTPTDPEGPTGPTDPEVIPSFEDLGPVASWAGEAIGKLAALGIIKGMTDEQFAPLNQVTRAQFITMLVRALGLEDAEASVTFGDVSRSAWHYEYIAAGVKAGIAQGTGTGRFNPDKPITREEMAIMAANALKLVNEASGDESTLDKFSDKESIASYAREAVALLTQQGVINGMGNDTFAPKGVANRAQAAVIIYRMLELLED
ncbi:M20/M25/M40 family metallo-hydrolase [Paenibacillus sp. CAU 1782]